MKLLTKELINKFNKIGSQENIEDPIIVAKFFHPFSNYTWYATEYNELLIERQKDWFHRKCIPLINKFWEDVLHYRTKPMEEIKNLIKTKKKEPPPPKMDAFVTTNAPPPALFLSDSDED